MVKLDPYEPYVVGYEGLRRTCIDYMDFLESEEYHEDKVSDYKCAIFETALKFVYGPNIFPEVYRRIKEQEEK